MAALPAAVLAHARPRDLAPVLAVALPSTPIRDQRSHAVDVVGVVGAGVMGAGIAQLALEAGHEVVLSDVDTAAIDRATDRIRDGLGRRAVRLELDPDSIDDWIDGRILRLEQHHRHGGGRCAGERQQPRRAQHQRPRGPPPEPAIRWDHGLRATT